VVQALRLVRLAPAHDVTLVQRLLLPAPFRRLLRRRARALVYDFDDALYATSGEGGEGSRWLAPRAGRWASMLSDSRAAIAATDHLADRARTYQRRTSVIASPVDTDRYEPPASTRPAGVVIGWIGSPETSPYVEPLVPLFRRLAARHPGLRIELVGAEPRLAGDGVRVHPWSWDTEVRLLQGFDVGVMPLPDNEWTRGKAGYKVLQYMACGTAAVASPVGSGRELIRPGETGWLAADDGAWEETLTELIGDATGRRRMGRAGRELAETRYALSRWTPRLHEILESVASGA
jgi:glycosyltransferase involved in cell wall biosynthesis